MLKNEPMEVSLSNLAGHPDWPVFVSCIEDLGRSLQDKMLRATSEAQLLTAAHTWRAFSRLQDLVSKPAQMLDERARNLITADPMDALRIARAQTETLDWESALLQRARASVLADDSTV